MHAYCGTQCYAPIQTLEKVVSNAFTFAENYIYNFFNITYKYFFLNRIN